MKHKKLLARLLLPLCVLSLVACGQKTADKNVATVETFQRVGELTDTSVKEYPYETKSSYMIYYGELNQNIINEAKQYEVFILHPRMGNVTRDQVQEIRKSGTIVLGYITIGEDLRTANMTPEQMRSDSRFTGDGTGPKVDPRESGNHNLSADDIAGKSSPGGSGFASYFLDDNDHDGEPDFNPNFKCAYTNIGDPAWFEVLDKMTIDGEEKIPGIREILSDDYGRALGCDGLFLDTIDTCAPNSFTSDEDPGRTRFEWTAPGVLEFTKHLKEAYPDKLVLQNRGIFFYNPQLPHYQYTPRAYVDYVMYESFMLDSNPGVLYNESFHADNLYAYAPKLIAEASRPDGFQVLSLGYAEGPEEYQLKETLVGNSTVGNDILMADAKVAEDLGFMHYITDGYVTMTNDYVIHLPKEDDVTAPVWSSVYNDSTSWPPHAPTARVGVSEVVAGKGSAIVRWDLATDAAPVEYVLYYQQAKFDFEADPELSSATSVVLTPEVGDGYVNGTSPSVYPYQATIDGLESGKTYYFLLRARDTSENHNEDDNTVVLNCKIK